MKLLDDDVEGVAVLLSSNVCTLGDVDGVDVAKAVTVDVVVAEPVVDPDDIATTMRTRLLWSSPINRLPVASNATPRG